jgi:RNA polymerase sigma factor (sigma-70 family)
MVKSIVKIQDHIGSQLEKDSLLESIMDEYGDRLTKLSFNYLRDWGQAQEVVQDVFVSCYKHLDEYQQINSFKSWIYRVTINKCKDRLRSSLLKRFIFNNEIFTNMNSMEPTPEDQVLKDKEAEFLSECVLSLPVKYREIIILFYYEELSIEEISSLLNMNTNTIKTRLKRSRDLLKTNLESGENHGR